MKYRLPLMRWIFLIFVAATGFGQEFGVGSANSARRLITPPAAAQPAGPPGAIRGQVVSLSGEPLRKAEVTIRSMRPGMEPSGQSQTTDAIGGFAFENLPAGSYMMQVQRNGYVPHQFGAPAGRGRGTPPITVAAGQSVTGVSIKMSPHAVITGRVLDEDGEPVARAMVQVMRERYNRGKRQMLPMQGDATDDRGEYRIHSLNSGKYYVSAAQMRHFEGGMQIKRIEDAPDLAYATVYYPGALELSQASSVELAAGQEARGIDFKLQKVATYRVRGRVLDEAGKPAQNTSVMAMPAEGATMGMAMRGGSAVRNAEGQFEISGLTPGTYGLIAQRMGGRDDARLMAMQQVTVGSRNLDEVVLNLSKGFELSGLVKVEGDLTLQPGNVRVMLEPFVPGPFGFSQAEPSKPDGSFHIKNVASARYRPNVSSLPEGTYLKTVKYAGQDVLEAGLTPSAGGELEVILGVKAPQVSGTVQDEKGEALPTAMILLVPSTTREQYWRHATAITDQNGSFVLKGIAPGDYKAFASANFEDGELQNPDYLKLHESRGFELKLKEGANETVKLKALP